MKKLEKSALKQIKGGIAAVGGEGGGSCWLVYSDQGYESCWYTYDPIDLCFRVYLSHCSGGQSVSCTYPGCIMN